MFEAKKALEVVLDGVDPSFSISMLESDDEEGDGVFFVGRAVGEFGFDGSFFEDVSFAGVVDVSRAFELPASASGVACKACEESLALVC